MAVPVPDQSALQCAQYASRSWSVAVQGNRLSITPGPFGERDGLPFALPVPASAVSAAGDTGDRHALQVPGGWLVGFDDGAQQGSLWWFDARGTRADKLFGYDASAWNALSQTAQAPVTAVVGGGTVPTYPLIGNVHAIVRVRDGIIALTGSSGASNGSSGQGGALALTRAAGHWTVMPIALLDGAPRAYTTDSSGELLVLTDNSISRISAKSGLTTLTPFEHFSLSAHSLAAGPGGSIFVGLQQYVVRLDRAPGAYAAQWFAPDNCPLFASANGSGCRCLGASGVRPYSQRVRVTDPAPTHIIAGSDGALWFTESAAHSIGRITSTGSIAVFPADVDATSDLVAAPNGSVWYSSANSSITQMTSDGKTVPIALSSIAGWVPTIDRLATGDDGALWFVADGSTKLVHVTAEGKLIAAAIPEPQFDQLGVVSLAGGAMWFTVASADQVGVVTPAGDVRLYAVPALGSGPMDPVRGPGGGVWFLEAISGNLGAILPDGRVNETPIAPASGFGSAIVSGAAYSFVFGPDSNFWLTEPDEDMIVRVTPAGAATDFATPRGSHPTGLAVGSDGALWFAEEGAGKIGRITTAGAITQFALPPFEIDRYL
jgi:virginiamycin B lyase